jgi:integrase/recombinase XerD
MSDPTAGLRRHAAATSGPEPLSDEQMRAVLRLRVPLREQALWHAVYDSGGGIERILALDVPDLDPGGRRTRPQAAGTPLHWRPTTDRLLALLAAGRPSGPLFHPDRRAPTATPACDRCSVTGRGRLSYRRAAELFTAATQGLDDGGRGWTLWQLRRG